MIQSGAPVTTVPLIRVTNDSPCLCSAPPRIIKRAWPSPKWSWPPPTSETRTAGASTSTRPSRTSGRPSTCGVHQRLGSGQTAYSNTARCNLIDEGGGAGALLEYWLCSRAQQVSTAAKNTFCWINFFMVADTAVERSALTAVAPCRLSLCSNLAHHISWKKRRLKDKDACLCSSQVLGVSQCHCQVDGESSGSRVTSASHAFFSFRASLFFFYYSVHTEIPFKMTNSIILWMT